MYCTYQYTFLFYYIETKAKDGAGRSANGNDFNDYGNTYALRIKLYFDYIMMNDDDCIIDG